MCLSACLLLPLAAQSPGGEWEQQIQLGGATYAANFSQDLDWLGDIDGDGCDDFIVGAPRHDVGSTSGIEMGAIFVYSGRTGQELFSQTAAGTLYRLGWRVSRAGDVDLDGVPDFAFLMQAGTGLVNSFLQVVSGATYGSLLQIPAPPNVYHFGLAGMRGGTDINLDGVPDFVVADSEYWGTYQFTGVVMAFDGASGALIWQAEGAIQSESLGLGVACPGDLTGDGRCEVLAASQSGVHVLSGLDGGDLYVLSDPYPTAYLGQGGHRMDGAGDVDSDGLPDIYIAAAQPEYAGINGYGTIHRGYDGAIIHRWEGPVHDDDFGAAIASLGDVDADGIGDFAVGAPENNFPNNDPGRVFIYSGRTKFGLALFSGSLDSLQFGFTLAPRSGDANGDGLQDVLIGDPAETVGGLAGAGAVHVFSFNPFLRASTLTISNAAGGTLGFALDFPASEAGRGYRFLASNDLPGSTTVQGVKIPLVVTPLLLRILHNPPALLQNPVGTLDANGDGAVSANFPANALPGYVGLTLKFAAISEFSPGVPSLSSAPAWVEITP